MDVEFHSKSRFRALRKSQTYSTLRCYPIVFRHFQLQVLENNLLGKAVK